ncbi:MAG: 5-methylcytosine-specific restriction endonuclease McrA [Pirellulaceae bacterium]|jgi:5-methylcytosine-specific restriction endonuclease McrA
MVTNVVKILDSSVLVLNRHYLPVQVVPVRRAFVMLYSETAEVIDIEEGVFANYDFETWCELSHFRFEEQLVGEEIDWIRTVNFSIQIPRVIRLLAFDRTPKHTLRFNRSNILARDDHRCQYCGRTPPSSQLSLDHVIPRSRGGETNWENIVCSCVPCNTKKGGRTPKEAQMPLLNQPKRPHHNPLLLQKLNNPKYLSWKTFLPSAKLASH